MSHIAVVGAGVFGGWIALRLAESGHRVTLVDAYGPGNPRASSADHTRVIRAGYGPDAIYSRWVAQARRDWQWLAETSGWPLMTKTGALFMGAPDAVHVRESHATLQALEMEAEWLEPADLAKRFPQIAVDGLGPALFEPEAGVLRAHDCMSAIAGACTRARVTYRVLAIAPPDESLAAPRVLSITGEPLEADAYVFACGPWLPRMFPEAIGSHIRATRQEVLFFGTPPGDGRFRVDQLPVWVDFDAGLYGIPDLDARGFKVGVDRHGPAIDPDTATRLVDGEIVDDTRAWMARRFPALASAPLVHSRVCQYENTATGDFIIDRHPAWANVWIAGGGSGHGFKHGPVVGSYVAHAIEGRGTAEPRFALQDRPSSHQRAVF